MHRLLRAHRRHLPPDSRDRRLHPGRPDARPRLIARVCAEAPGGAVPAGRRARRTSLRGPGDGRRIPAGLDADPAMSPPTGREFQGDSIHPDARNRDRRRGPDIWRRRSRVLAPAGRVGANCLSERRPAGSRGRGGAGDRHSGRRSSTRCRDRCGAASHNARPERRCLDRPAGRLMTKTVRICGK